MDEDDDDDDDDEEKEERKKKQAVIRERISRAGMKYDERVPRVRDLC